MAVMFLMTIVAVCIKKVREKIFTLIVTTVKEFYWNNTIQMINISYLPQGIVMVTAFVTTLRLGKGGQDFIANIT